MTAAGLRRDDVVGWLSAERQEDEAAAERAFARVFAALPGPAPGAAFAERVAAAAFQARRRRRLWLRSGRMTASAAAAVLGVVLGYLALVRGGAWLVRAGAAVTVQSVSLVVRSAAEGLDWWSILVRVGTAVGDALSTPQVSTAVLGIEILGAAALFALSRMLRTEKRNPDSWEART
jgi:hypothetical protein